MKPTFNKAQIFKLAHTMFRQMRRDGFQIDFAYALRRAWAVAKGTMLRVRDDLARNIRVNSYGCHYPVVIMPWSNVDLYRLGA